MTTITFSHSGLTIRRASGALVPPGGRRVGNGLLRLRRAGHEKNRLNSTVENNGASAADTVTVTDVVPAGTTFVSGSIRTAVGGAGTVCDSTGTGEDDDTLGANETDPAGGSYAAGTVTVNIEPSIAGSGGLSRAAFQVTID